MVELLQFIFQALMALILGIFGFSWSDSEEDQDSSVVFSAVYRIEQPILPMVRVSYATTPNRIPLGAARVTRTNAMSPPIPVRPALIMPPKRAKAGCASDATSLIAVERPEVISANYQPITS